MKRYSIVLEPRSPVWVRCDSLGAAVDLVVAGAPGVSRVHPDARDSVRIREHDRREPYQLIRTLTLAEARAEVESSSPPTQPPGEATPSVSPGPSSDAMWCGILSQTLRETLHLLENDSKVAAAACITDALERYEAQAGFPPHDATLIGTRAPGDLKPGEREIGGFVYYSDKWLDQPTGVH